MHIRACTHAYMNTQRICYYFSVDLTANDLLHRVFPDSDAKKEALKLSPERYCMIRIDYKLVTCLSQYSS